MPGEGNSEAQVVFIGEAPGREEAATGRPFTGRSGKFFRGVLRDFGIDAKDVFITSPVKYLPLSGTPTIENINHSRKHLLKQLNIIKPLVLVLMGNTACLALLGRKSRTTEEHGSIIKIDNRICLITFHPAYAMRFPDGKKGFLQDFKKLKKLIDA